MPRAEITLPTGAKVVVEGSLEEIDALIKLYSADGGRTSERSTSRSSSSGTRSPRATRAVGPVSLIRELREEGFFNRKQPLAAIVSRLGEQGHHYAPAAVAKALLRLARGKELGRLREQGVWVYVRR